MTTFEFYFYEDVLEVNKCMGSFVSPSSHWRPLVATIARRDFQVGLYSLISYFNITFTERREYFCVSLSYLPQKILISVQFAGLRQENAYGMVKFISNYKNNFVTRLKYFCIQ